VSGRRFKRRMAYVLQDDIFFPSITVRDTVTDAAYLKLPKSMSLKEKRAKVDDVLSELGLERCSGTIVGGGWVVRRNRKKGPIDACQQLTPHYWIRCSTEGRVRR
jgi:ABC-type lipopolysaccharide export system ATPase subunit